MRTLFHVAHGAIIAMGALAVLATLVPGQWRYRRSLRRLRRAGDGAALIRLAEARATRELSHGDGDTASSRPLLIVAALASVTAAAIHGAVGPEHFQEALRLGLFFVLICATQLFLAAALLRRPSRAMVIVNVVVNAGTVLLWILTRTVGLPLRLAEIEPFGVLDTLSSAAELVVVGCCLTWLQRAPAASARVSRRPYSAFAGLTARQQEGS